MGFDDIAAEAFLAIVKIGSMGLVVGIAIGILIGYFIWGG